MEKRINAADRLLNQSMERLTKQLELFNQMHSLGIDTTEAELVLKIMQQTLAQQIDRLETATPRTPEESYCARRRVPPSERGFWYVFLRCNRKTSAIWHYVLDARAAASTPRKALGAICRWSLGQLAANERVWPDASSVRPFPRIAVGRRGRLQLRLAICSVRRTLQIALVWSASEAPALIVARSSSKIASDFSKAARSSASRSW